MRRSQSTSPKLDTKETTPEPLVTFAFRIILRILVGRLSKTSYGRVVGLDVRVVVVSDLAVNMKIQVLSP